MPSAAVLHLGKRNDTRTFFGTLSTYLASTAKKFDQINLCRLTGALRHEESDIEALILTLLVITYLYSAGSYEPIMSLQRALSERLICLRELIG
jgi:hypothetical protein